MIGLERTGEAAGTARAISPRSSTDLDRAKAATATAVPGSAQARSSREIEIELALLVSPAARVTALTCTSRSSTSALIGPA
jgi:hypothetical protein